MIRKHMLIYALSFSIAVLPACTATRTVEGFTVAGAADESMAVSFAKAERIAADVGLREHVQLYFNEDSSRVVFFQLYGDISAGEYIISGSEQADANVIANYVEVGGTIYESTSGTLTLEKAGDAYTGQFEFTALPLLGEGEEVTITGSFNDVKLIQ